MELVCLWMIPSPHVNEHLTLGRIQPHHAVDRQRAPWRKIAQWLPRARIRLLECSPGSRPRGAIGLQRRVIWDVLFSHWPLLSIVFSCRPLLGVKMLGVGFWGWRLARLGGCGIVIVGGVGRSVSAHGSLSSLEFLDGLLDLRIGVSGVDVTPPLRVAKILSNVGDILVEHCLEEGQGSARYGIGHEHAVNEDFGAVIDRLCLDLEELFVAAHFKS